MLGAPKQELLRKVILMRRNLSGVGGAERVFRKYKAALSADCEVVPISEAPGTKGAGWWRAILFTLKADSIINQNPDALSISLERGPSAQVFRAGDGVHKHFRSLVKKNFLSGLSFNPWHFFAPILDKKSIHAARVIIANSQMVGAEVRRYYPESSDKIRVVYNGFDPKKFFVSDESVDLIRERLDLKKYSLNKEKLFLFAGSGWKRKGLLQAIEITKRAPDAKLVVVGKGKRSEVSFLKNNPVLNSIIIYRGVVDNIGDYYRACDALILPTLYDPFSSVVLEALACGTPVVTTAQNGAAEIIKNNLSGFVMKTQNEDFDKAAEFLRSVEGNSIETKKTIAETVKNYTLQNEIDAIEKIFKELEGQNV